MSDQREFLLNLEAYAEGPIKTAQLLAVDYTGSYPKWESGKKRLPGYVRESVLAHLALYVTRNLAVKKQVM